MGRAEAVRDARSAVQLRHTACAMMRLLESALTVLAYGS